jgi:hypothetical protein
METDPIHPTQRAASRKRARDKGAEDEILFAGEKATDGKKSRFVVFIDVLGTRRALSLGLAEVADRKISSLASIVSEVLGAFPKLHAHGATDCFLIWTEPNEHSWEIVAATGRVLERYFDLNESEDITAKQYFRPEMNKSSMIRAWQVESSIEYPEAAAIQKRCS